MHHVLVYSDSLSWGIIPATRKRLAFDQRWPGVMENALTACGHRVRVIEDCLNGRRTVWDDPYKPGRNGLHGLAQRIEIHSPLSLVILLLGTNDFQSVHQLNAWQSAQGIGALVAAIRGAPVEPGMPVPPVLVVAPPPILAPKGPIAPKFEGSETRSVGLARAYEQIAQETGCYFFDSGTVVTASNVDGIHLDFEQHVVLGSALSQVVAPWLATGNQAEPTPL
jgi:lysophospholipase L1-like esterase